MTTPSPLTYVRRAGRTLARQAAFLVYAQQDPAVPLWARVTAGSALLYLVSPLDAVPDALPGVGFADDAAVVGGAAVHLVAFASAKTHARADAFADRWFGPAVG